MSSHEHFRWSFSLLNNKRRVATGLGVEHLSRQACQLVIACESYQPLFNVSPADDIGFFSDSASKIRAADEDCS